MEADDIIGAIEFGHVARELMLFGVEPPKHALKSDINRDIADFVTGFGSPKANLVVFDLNALP